MQETGVRYGCLNFEYVWYRTPDFSVAESCNFLEKLLVYPGRVDRDFPVESYQMFLEQNRESIDVALGVPGLEETGVTIIPYGDWVSYFESIKPFAKIRFKKRADNGEYLHGADVTWPFLKSMNTGVWMKGTQGIMSDFRNDKMTLRFGKEYATSLGRRLKEQGYKVDLLKLKKGDWRELARINCINWSLYLDKEN